MCALLYYIYTFFFKCVRSKIIRAIIKQMYHASDTSNFAVPSTNPNVPVETDQDGDRAAVLPGGQQHATLTQIHGGQ